jgi:light-harvesting complex I chlorophyll a/b binding protein 1
LLLLSNKPRPRSNATMKLWVSTTIAAAFHASSLHNNHQGGRRRAAASTRFFALPSSSSAGDESPGELASSSNNKALPSSSSSSFFFDGEDLFDQEEVEIMRRELEQIEKFGTKAAPSPRSLPQLGLLADEKNPGRQQQKESEGRPRRIPELEHIKKLERLLSEIKGFELEDEDSITTNAVDDEDNDDYMMWDDDESSLDDFLASLDDIDVVGVDDEQEDWVAPPPPAVVVQPSDGMESSLEAAARGLEKALLQGVVPVTTTIGSACIPGDFGFDPLGLADRDLFLPVQRFILNLLPGPRRWEDDDQEVRADTAKSAGSTKLLPRPKPLVLRDYRECEIRHGRICMLAAIIWPLQEMLDRWMLPPEQFGPVLLSFGPTVTTTTLPYFPLFMTACLLLLGYLDVYSQAIKDMDRLGEAFLPGDCFWDPLRILDGASDRTKRIMQERELFNGRAAMMAVAAYSVEELVTKRPFIELERNALLLEPAYQVPFIQRWLDDLFARNDPLFDSMDMYDYVLPDDVPSMLLDDMFVI